MLLLTGGFVLGEAIILQGSVVLKMAAAAAAVLLPACFARAVRRADGGGGRQKTGAVTRLIKGRSIWLWLLPFFVCAGMGRAWQEQRVAARELSLGLDGERIAAEGVVALKEHKGDWLVVTLKNVRVQETDEKNGSGKAPGGSKDRYHLRRLEVYVGGASTDAVKMGNRVMVRGECSAFEKPRNPGEFDYRLCYRSRKLTYRMFADSRKVKDNSSDLLGEGLYQLKIWAEGRLSETTGNDSGVFQAVILGDGAELPGEIRDLYRRNGIAHLLAVSGLHLSLVSLAVYGMMRRLGAGYGLSGLAGGAVLIAYGILTGSSSSVLRALIMALCGYLASYLGRTSDPLSSLALAALALFWDSPYLITQAGVQLSFLAVIGVCGAARLLARKFGGTAISGAFCAGVGIQLVTLPVLLYHFFCAPLYGIFLNLLVVPLLSIVIGTGVGGIALSCVSLPAARFFTGGGRAVLWWYEWCCELFGRLPGSNVIAGRPECWQIGLYYGILALLLSGIARGDGRGRRRLFALGAALFILLPLPVRGLSVTFLDVGQGDGVCLRTRQATILSDCGSTDRKNLGADSLAPFLLSNGIRRIDYAIVSHADQDHISGILYLLRDQEEIAVKNLVLPAAGRGGDIYGELEKLAVSRGCRVHWMGRGDVISAGKLRLSCLYPDREAVPGDGEEERNEHSLVLRADYGSFCMLLTGDMSAEGERKLLDGPLAEREALSDCLVLKVAHHGSDTSTSAEWLEALSPAFAVISCGEGNRYGHPHREVLDRLRECEVEPLITRDFGAVIIRTDGKGVKLNKNR